MKPKSVELYSKTEKQSPRFTVAHGLSSAGENSFELLEVGRFGGLKTSVDSTLYGNWRTSGQGIFMNWDDGMRTILRPIGSGFLLYEYKPGRPTDGVPTRIFSVTPENTAKLAAYTDGRWQVARQLRERAENSGFVSGNSRSGWSKAFRSRVQPSSKDTVQSAEAHSREVSYTLNTGDPWWWPLWSENQTTTEVEEAEAKRHQVTIDMDSPSNEVKTTKDVAQSKIKETVNVPSKPNWEWPF